MLELLKNHWDELLAVCAIIVALVPLVVEHIKIKNRQIYANVVDYSIVTNATVSNYDNTESATGTLLLLAVNLFVPHKSFFVETYEIAAQLKSGTVSRAIITDGSLTIHKNNKDLEFILPSDYNFNLHKEIICESDNIRIFEIMLVNAAITSKDDIDNLKFVFKNSECKKSIVLKTKDFPNFNKMRFLSEFEIDTSIF